MKQKILSLVPNATCLVASLAIAYGIGISIRLLFDTLWAKPAWPYELVWAGCRGGILGPATCISFVFICNWMMDRPFWHRFDKRYGHIA